MYGSASNSFRIPLLTVHFRIDKKLYVAQSIKHWIVVIYETQGRFDKAKVDEMAKAFCDGAKSIGEFILIAAVYQFFWVFVPDKGMNVEDRQPQVFWENAHENIIEVSDNDRKSTGRLAEIIVQQLEKAYISAQQKKKQPPSLIVVILPEGGNHIYTAVKQCVS